MGSFSFAQFLHHSNNHVVKARKNYQSRSRMASSISSYRKISEYRSFSSSGAVSTTFLPPLALALPQIT